jgi:hypothetical protein
MYRKEDTRRRRRRRRREKVVDPIPVGANIHPATHKKKKTLANHFRRFVS